MNGNGLTLELLTGPLDGHTVVLKEETMWGKNNAGPLAFPWDEELGDPQARFFPEDGQWWLEGYQARHGTYCVRREGRVEERVQIEEGDVLKASETWMRVHIAD
jgi:hypothetical protein